MSAWSSHPLSAVLHRLSRYRRVPRWLKLPEFPETVLTPARLRNLYLSRYEQRVCREIVQSLPMQLTLEPTNVCNLRCPACFTGIGENGRVRSLMSMELYQKLLDELGDTLMVLEFFNWGEPLLHKGLEAMIAAATERGIATVVSTNFSLPFSDERAEALVRAGLSVLSVSIDGARQESYEKYRVRGQLETVLNNCRAVVRAKKKLGRRGPRLYWGFHVFEHNVDDIPLAVELAHQIGMQISVEKGWVVGDEWDPQGPYKFFANVTPGPCDFLWQHAVVNNDGGVASCCGTFYQEDDMGRLAVQSSDLGAASFRAVWNGEGFRRSRRMYQARGQTPESDRGMVCYDCPQTVVWDRYKQHLAAGGSPATFEPGFSTNDSFNFFLQRRPKGGADTPPKQS